MTAKELEEENQEGFRTKYGAELSTGEDNVGFDSDELNDDKYGEDVKAGELNQYNLENAKGENGEEERQQWSNPIEFLLSCIAMSVGLGNVWRFPFTAYENGGGAFLIPYIIVLMLIGRPLYFLELAIGQFSSSSSVKVWNMVPAARGVGYGQMIGTASVVSYYCCLIALALHYLVSSMQGTLPWTVCHPSLSDPGEICVASLVTNSSFTNMTSTITTNMTEELDMDFEKMANVSLVKISAAEQYFKRGVLKENPDLSQGLGYPDLSLAACLAGCWVLLFFTLWKGVASSGKVAYFTAIFPYIVLITLLVRGLTLPGAMDGVLFYITPKWEELLNLKVWYAAVTQSFFSLSTGFGALITYASYNDFRHNSYRDALIISVADTLTSLLAGFVIFSILGNLASELGVPVDKVVASGPGLAFISYPSALAKFDFLPQLFSVLFFLMLVTLGLGSATGLTSGIIAVVCDNFPNTNKTLITGIICVIGFLVGLVYVTPGGQAILELVDFFGGGFIIFVLAMVEILAVSWIYGIKNVTRDIKFMINVSVGIYWKFCWGLFIPISLLGIFVYFLVTYTPRMYNGVPYPPAAEYAGYGLTLLAVIQLPFWFLRAVCRGETLFSPNCEWGPKKAANKKEWLDLQTLTEL